MKTVQRPPRLTYRLLTLSNTLGKGSVRLYAGKFGVPLAQWRLLAALAVEGPSSINGLAKALGTDKGWISRTAASLMAKGLAVGIKTHADSKRAKIGLTTKGEALHARIEPAANRRYKQLIAVLTARERRQLDYMLAKLQRRAEVLLDMEIRSPSRKLRRAK